MFGFCGYVTCRACGRIGSDEWPCVWVRLCLGLVEFHLMT